MVRKIKRVAKPNRNWWSGGESYSQVVYKEKLLKEKEKLRPTKIKHCKGCFWDIDGKCGILSFNCVNSPSKPRFMSRGEEM